MATISATTRPNGLPVHRVALPGTRATTVLVAFDAGARSEHADENGMAHFLEHLVFKGGEKYDHYRKVNETAENMGASINAFTSHDMVAFHITSRAEVAPAAIDLLTDFVGRPLLDADELDRERGVVIQEIQRARDLPSTVAEHLIDRAAYGEHPLGRMVLGPEDNLRTFTRDAILVFRDRRWSGRRGGAFIAGNVEHAATRSTSCSTACPSSRNPIRSRRSRRRGSTRSSRSATQTSRTYGSSTARRCRSTAARVPRSSSTRRCSAARWARGCSTRSANSAAWRTRSTRPRTPTPTRRSSSSARAWTRRSASRPMSGCARSSPSCIATARRARRSTASRAFAAGRQVLGIENSGAVARMCASMAIVHGEDPDPDGAIELLDSVTFEEVAAVARSIDPQSAAVAVVGPHEAGEF